MVGSHAIILRQRLGTQQVSATVCLVACLSACLSGCRHKEPLIAPVIELPSYGDLIIRHNRNVERIERVWAFTTLEMWWRDDGGKHYEQGDGQLALVLPDHLQEP